MAIPTAKQINALVEACERVREQNIDLRVRAVRHEIANQDLCQRKITHAAQPIATMPLLGVADSHPQRVMNYGILEVYDVDVVLLIGNQREEPMIARELFGLMIRARSESGRLQIEHRPLYDVPIGTTSKFKVGFRTGSRSGTLAIRAQNMTIPVPDWQQETMITFFTTHLPNEA